MEDPDKAFTTIDRDILKDPRVKCICLVGGKRWVVPMERYLDDYKDISKKAKRVIDSAFDYCYVDHEKDKRFGLFY